MANVMYTIARVILLLVLVPSLRQTLAKKPAGSPGNGPPASAGKPADTNENVPPASASEPADIPGSSESGGEPSDTPGSSESDGKPAETPGAGTKASAAKPEDTPGAGPPTFCAEEGDECTVEPAQGYCLRPGNSDTGKLKCIGGLGLPCLDLPTDEFGFFIPDDLWNIYDGAKAKLYCCLGHYVNETTITCNAPHWSTPTDSCAKVDCGDPDSIPHATYVIYGTGLGLFMDFAEYTCVHPYHPVGGPSCVHCGPDGEWSSTSLSCSDG